MNMKYYPSLHLYTNYSKGTACSKKGYWCRWTWLTIRHYTYTQIIVKEQLVVKKGYWCRWTWKTIRHYTYTQIIVKEQLVVRKDIDLDEHDWLFNITLRHLNAFSMSYEVQVNFGSSNSDGSNTVDLSNCF